MASLRRWSTKTTSSQPERRPGPVESRGHMPIAPSWGPLGGHRGGGTARAGIGASTHAWRRRYRPETDHPAIDPCPGSPGDGRREVGTEKEAELGTERIGIPRRDARSGTARGAPRRMAGSVWVAAPPQWGRPPAAGRRASNPWPAPTEGVAPISRRKPRGRYKFLQCKSLHAETGDASNLVRWTIGTPPIRRGHPVLSATQGPCGHC